VSALLSVALFPRKHARHAKPSKTAPVLVAGGLTTALAVVDASAFGASASAAASNATWERLAQCESGGRWNINTGNGYYGGLQFNLQTWRGLGFGGYPHQASKATQIAAANKLHDARGFGPWPACSRKLGLRGGGGGTAATSTVRSSTDRRAAAARASRSRAQAAAAAKAAAARAAAAKAARRAAILALKPTAPPAWGGEVLNLEHRNEKRADVQAWQARMAARGWHIAVDGHFGPQSAAVAQKFAADKKIPTVRPGLVDQQVWNAAWNTAVTL
jgi:hypothetical protein